MGLFSAFTGNVSEISALDARAEFEPILFEGEMVLRAFKLVRDVILLTNCRIITVDKQGVTGKKRSISSFPYRDLHRITVESAGHLDFDAELYLFFRGMAAPLKWEFSKAVNINEIYRLISQYAFAGH